MLLPAFLFAVQFRPPYPLVHRRTLRAVIQLRIRGIPTAIGVQPMRVPMFQCRSPARIAFGHPIGAILYILSVFAALLAGLCRIRRPFPPQPT
jgi:hypothetical protein